MRPRLALPVALASSPVIMPRRCLAEFRSDRCSNPPYIRSSEIAGLATRVRDHDPRQALDGGPDGLDCLSRPHSAGPPAACAQGALIVEIGQGQSGEIEGFDDGGGFKRAKGPPKPIWRHSAGGCGPKSVLISADKKCKKTTWNIPRGGSLSSENLLASNPQYLRDTVDVPRRVYDKTSSRSRGIFQVVFLHFCRGFMRTLFGPQPPAECPPDRLLAGLFAR